MNITTYKKWNLFLGWFVFITALIIYTLTVEPTASFWDCGEYIATSVKLQIGHPPGAPFFQMLGAFFAIFTNNPEKIALTINMMSVVSSAFTVLFLFWISTNILCKLTSNKHLQDRSYAVSVLGSALVGTLAFVFSDSFWFNAVEAEVYAMAMLTLSVLFWLGIKWTDNLDKPRSNKWFLLMCLLIGLSFGVHFMALLVIPAIGMLYYFKTSKTTLKGFIKANLLSIAILLFIFKLLLPYTLSFFGFLEVFFVNSMGFPFNSGTIIAGAIIVFAFYRILAYSRKKSYVYLNTLSLGVMFILIGFSTWLMLPIRANANTVINENSPTDARLLLAYYNLEQYPETHLFYGPMYTDAYAEQDKDNPYKDDKPKYERDYKSNKYIVVNNWKNAQIAPNSNHLGFLPRMWSSEHAKNYINLTGYFDFSIKKEFKNNEQLKQIINDFKNDLAIGKITSDSFIDNIKTLGGYLDIEKSSFIQNMTYLFKYQINYMYIRYFMWNFAGRQDDQQGELNNHGNWLSGINFIDEFRLGSQINLPSDTINNKARNTYFLLPLILGLIGVYVLFKRNKQQFWILLLLFTFTGLALKIYLNERAFEPRERDYALVGSFYTFAICISIGTLAIFIKLKNILNKHILSFLIPIICFAIVPLLMAFQNWDDHDRSNKYTAQSMAKSYLGSIQKDVDAMLFTIGDNDTFALWYAQEVENFRTDVRTINTSLLATDWYIDQMKKKTYSSSPIPSQLTHDKYAYGTRDAVYFQELTENRWALKDFISWIASDDQKTKINFKSGQTVDFYPTNKVRLTVNKANVLKSGLVKPKDSSLIEEYIDIDLPKSALTKNRLLMLDILANNDWKRPIYFTGGSYDSAEYFWLKEYLQLDGLVYKLVPIRTPINKSNPYEMGRIDSDLMYDLVVNWNWGNSKSPDIYHDPETRKNSITYRSNIARLSKALITEGKFQKAEYVLDLAMENMPLNKFGYYSLLHTFIESYYNVENEQKARNLFEKIKGKYQEHLEYYKSLNLQFQTSYNREIITNVERYRNILKFVIKNDSDIEYVKSSVYKFNSYIGEFPYFYEKHEKEKL